MKKLKKYSVVIPYFHRFEVEATDKWDALDKAHSSSGKIIGYSDADAEVEEIN